MQAAIPLLRSQGGGHILPVSSVVGLVGRPIAGIYGATKFAVECMAEALAEEVSEFGIKITIIEPAAFATDFLGSSLRLSPALPYYDNLRMEQARHLDPANLGDPKSTPAAIFRVVDADDPPLRLFLGPAFPMIRHCYEERLQCWSDWDDVATGKALT